MIAMIEGMIGAVVGAMVTLAYQSRHDFIAWWNRKRYGKNTAFLTVPEEMVENIIDEWTDYARDNTDTVVILNGKVL